MGQCCGYLSSNSKSKNQKQIKDEIDMMLDEKKSDQSLYNDPNQSQIQQDQIQINFNASFLNTNSFQNQSFVLDKPSNSDQQQDLAAEKYQNYNGQASSATRQNNNKNIIHEMKNFTSADGLKVTTNGLPHKSAFKKNSFTQSLNPQAQLLQQQAQEKVKREKTVDTLQQEIPTLADIKHKKNKNPSKIIQPNDASQIVTDASTKDQTINNNHNHNHGGTQEKDQNIQNDKPESSSPIKKQNSHVVSDQDTNQEPAIQAQKSLKQMINQQQDSQNDSSVNNLQEIKSVVEQSQTNLEREEEKKKNLNLSKLKEKGDKDVQSEFGRNKSHKSKKLHRKNSNKTNKTSKTILKEEQKGEEQTKTYKSILRHNDRIGSGTNRRVSGQTQNRKRVKFNLKENTAANNNQGRRSRFSQSKDKT